MLFFSVHRIFKVVFEYLLTNIGSQVCTVCDDKMTPKKLEYIILISDRSTESSQDFLNFIRKYFSH